jgi:cobaltochelatase CobT
MRWPSPHAVAGLLEDAAAKRQDGADGRGGTTPSAAFGCMMDLDDAAEAEQARPPSSPAQPCAGRQRRTGTASTPAYDREFRPAALVRREQLRGIPRCGSTAASPPRGVNLNRLARELKAAAGAPQPRRLGQCARKKACIDGRRAGAADRLADRAAPVPQRTARAAGRLRGDLPDRLLGLDEDSMPSRWRCWSTCSRARWRWPVWPAKCWASPPAPGTAAARLRDWQRAGQPAHPGRLNESTHLVFKDAQTAWRRARPASPRCCKADLFREGVDGEALAWACEAAALARRSAQAAGGRLRRLPDGRRHRASPTTPTTWTTTCSRWWATSRWRAMWNWPPRRRPRPEPFYRRCQAIDLAPPPDNALFGEILQLIGGRHRR